jgi:hypothetical protein
MVSRILGADRPILFREMGPTGMEDWLHSLNLLPTPRSSDKGAIRLIGSLFSGSLCGPSASLTIVFHSNVANVGAPGGDCPGLTRTF